MLMATEARVFTADMRFLSRMSVRYSTSFPLRSLNIWNILATLSAGFSWEVMVSLRKLLMLAFLRNVLRTPNLLDHLFVKLEVLLLD